MLRSTRRSLLVGTGSLIAAPAVIRAQSAYPDRPIRVLVPFGPGGLADVTIRIIGEKLSTLVGQSIVVVNQPGANGVTAARTVLGAEADGYTLALLTNGTAVSTAMQKAPAFDPVREFEPITSLGFFDFIFVTAANGPFASLKSFIDAARAKPNTLNIGTIATGSTQNLTAVLFKALAGIDCAIVPFRTTPEVMTATLRGDVAIGIDGYSAAKALIGDKQLIALASSGAERSSVTQSIATVREQGINDFDVTSWNALFARRGTPSSIIEALNRKLAEALNDAEVRGKLADLGITGRGSTPREIGDRLQSDITRWSAVIERAGIQRT